MLRIGARVHVHQHSSPQTSEVRPISRNVDNALLATKFCDTVYNTTDHSVKAKDKSPNPDLPSMIFTVGEHNLTIHFPKCAASLVSSQALKEDGYFAKPE
jgi:hypothetical protein